MSDGFAIKKVGVSQTKMARTSKQWVIDDQSEVANSKSFEKDKRRKTSLGILYQSRNREMRIGALKGLRGDPVVDITSKGLFEESELPYNIDYSQVEMCDLNEAKKQQMHKQRSQ